MPRLQERQAQLATIRKRPLSPKLAALIEVAAVAAGVDEVVCFSGGQYAAPDTRRTGSPRHDNGNAGDFDLRIKGRILNFEVPADRVKFAAFVTACVKGGATGIGAGVNYMGPTRIHVGFGSRAVWGDGGKTAGAPKWLIDAVAAGRI